MIGGLFLMLSYFGCDQSQVQRYLTAKSIDEARHSLLMSAYAKIPLQLLILAAGVLVFIFYVFQTPPMLFNRTNDARVAAGPYAAEYAALQAEFDTVAAARRQAGTASDRAAFLASDARLVDIRKRAVDVVNRTRAIDGIATSLRVPTFIRRNAHRAGGSDVAAIFAAAMSAASSDGALGHDHRFYAAIS